MRKNFFDKTENIFAGQLTEPIYFRQTKNWNWIDFFAKPKTKMKLKNSCKIEKLQKYNVFLSWNKYFLSKMTSIVEKVNLVKSQTKFNLLQGPEPIVFSLPVFIPVP